MATLIDALHRGNVPEYFPALGKFEEMSPSLLVKEVLQGRIVIPRNNRRKGPFTPVAIGKNTRVKINANVRTSPERRDFDWNEQKRHALDPRRFSDFLETSHLSSSEKKPCSMCGEWCALKGLQKE